MERFTRILAWVMLAATLATLAASWMSWLPPRWWRPPSPDNPRTQAVAWEVERRLVEEAQRIRVENESWSIRVHDGSINAWLATRLREWMAHDPALAWPEEVATAQVRFTHAGIDIALALRERGRQRVVGLRCIPRLAHGRLQLDPADPGVGMLPLPRRATDEFLMRVRESMATRPADQASAAIELLNVLSGRSTVAPVILLADDRSVEVLDLQCRKGELILKCRTHPAGMHAVSSHPPALRTGSPENKQD